MKIVLLALLLAAVASPAASLVTIPTAVNTVYQVRTFEDLKAVVGTPNDSPTRVTGKLDTVGIYGTIVFTEPLTITGAFYIVAFTPTAVFDVSGVLDDEGITYMGPFNAARGARQRETILKGITIDGKRVERTAPCMLVAGGLIKFEATIIQNCVDKSPDSAGGAIAVTNPNPRQRVKVQFVGASELTGNSANTGGSYAVSGRNAKITFCYTRFFNNAATRLTKDGVASSGAASDSCYGGKGTLVSTPPATTGNDTGIPASEAAKVKRVETTPDRCPFGQCKKFAEANPGEFARIYGRTNKPRSRPRL